MKKKKLLALVLTFTLAMSMAACGDNNAPGNSTSSDGTSAEGSSSDTAGGSVESTENGGDTTQSAGDTYTFYDYAPALATNWNPHTWETNADDAILSTYLSSGFVDISILDTEEMLYQWTYEMATSVEDVTGEHQEDLTKYGVTLQEGKTAEDTTEGYVFEIKLNPDAKWEDGTPINADSYIYSMKQLLDPDMKNYRANLYYSGESAVAGGEAYYFQGSTVWMDNSTSGNYTIADLVLGDDGVYTTPDGATVTILVNAESSYLGGDTLATYVTNYGEEYFNVADFEKLAELADAEGRAPLTEESLALLVSVISTQAAWGETADDAPSYLAYSKEFPEVNYDDVVGCYKVDDYTIRYVNQFYIDKNYFLVSCVSTWLVSEDLYEAGKDTSGSLVTTNYGTSAETTKSYGPYRLESMQQDKQMVFVQNENWYGYEKDENGNLVSYTNFEVDGEKKQQYITDKVIINVMDNATAKQAFLKGELSNWSPDADDLVAYSTSDKLYKADETYTMSFFFNCGLDNLKTMDASKGNTNSVVLSNVNFREALSLAIDRNEYVSATAGYKPAYSLLNSLYYYDVYNDPSSMYRSSDEAMQAICNLYDVSYGEGTPYATLKDAYDSINGYNLTQAKELMAQACQELVSEGLYTEGDPISIRIAWAAGALESSDTQQCELMNKYINAAAEGSGFGPITLEPIGNLNNRYADVSNGEYAIGYGAWGGAAFYPFRTFRVYCDPDYVQIHEAGCWDPATETLTLDVKGEPVTMTWKEWSNALTGSGVYSNSDFDLKLSVTAQMEEEYLKKYYRIPLCATTVSTLLSWQCEYYTDEYNIMYGFGGFRLLQYDYTDAEWAEYVSSQNGALNYE